MCAAAVLIVVSVTFYIYGSSQNRQFELMEKETQTKSAMLQSQKIQTDIAQLEGRLSAVSEMVIASDLDPEDEWLDNYLVHISEKETLINKAVYVSMDDLRQNLSRPEVPDEAEDTYKALMNGQRVYTEIIYSHRLSDYYFGIAEPVLRNGEAIGTIRCTIPASELVQTESLSMLPLPDNQFIVDSDGTVLFSYGSLDLTGSSLFDFLEAEFSPTHQENTKLKQGMQEKYTVTESAGGYFVTSSPLFVHHWNLVQFASKGSMQQISDKLLLHTVILCLIISMVLIGMVCIMLKNIYTKNSSIAFQQKKTASLATVFDVLLLEYDPGRDQMVLTPGDNCVYALDNLVITKCRDHHFNNVHPDDLETFVEFIRSPRAAAFELRLLGKDGRWIWSDCQMLPVSMNKKDVSYAGKIFDIHERKLRELKLMEENIRDSMTGLMNRTALKEYVTMLLDRKTAGFFFMIDIDNFKAVNDTYGHAAGDEMICRFSEVLRDTFRETDLIGRVGGDEFTVYMPGTGSKRLAAEKAKNILDGLAFLSEREGILISASIGIARYPDDGTDYEELLRKSDKAMYDAKRGGKNNFSFCKTILIC